MKHRIYSARGQASQSERRNVVPRLSIILTLMGLFGVFLNATSRASTITWVGGNGAWDTVANWDAGVAPGPGDTAQFNDSAQIGLYAVGLNISNEVVANVLFGADNFGMYLKAGTNTLTVNNSYLLDEPSGTIAVDYLHTGVVAVTNSTATGVFQVGNDNDGGVGLLTMEQQYTNSTADATATNNPTLIANTFNVTASSTFTFTDGTLTTGGGSISSASTFSGLAPASNSVATWNIHGTNLVTSGGGVELGYSVGGTLNINVTGPNTLWSVNATENDIGWNGFVNLTISGGAVVVMTNGTYTYISRNGTTCSNNTVTVSGAGSEFMYNSLLWVGNASRNNTMTVSAGAQVSGGGLELGSGAGSSNNLLTVTGTNTTWNLANILEVGGNGANNTLIISNGAQVIDAGTFTGVGMQSTSTNNAVIVDGAGSVWSTASGGGHVTVGNFGAYDSVTVKNGGQVLGSGLNLGDGNGASNCTVLLTGPGSLWNDAGKFGVGVASSGNQLIVTNGAQLNTANLYVGFGDTAPALGNSVVVAGGSLFVTNASSALYIGGGGAANSFTFNGGTITVNELVLSSASAFTFNSGVLNLEYAIVTNGSAFVVGNGTSAATLNLLPSFLHLYSSGLNISANGTLTGIGAISNNVTLANGATLAPGVSGVGTQTVDGTLVLGSTTALDFGLGLPGESQSFVSVNGNLTLNGTLNISNVGGFGVGTYTLFAYTGTLTTNGSPSILTIGTTPNGSLTYKIDISTAGEVNLDVTSPPANSFVTWQLQYFSSTNCAKCGANADYDGTGISNTNKFLAGFNPTDSAAYLHVITIAKTNNNTDVRVTYLGANGDSTYIGGPASRTNVLEFTTGTANGSYTNNFTSTGQTNILGGGTGLGVVTNMVDSGGATNKPSRFYRVRVILP